MLSRLLPPSVDNRYQGQKLAPWLLGLLMLAKLAMGLNIVLNGRVVATTADGIPLDAFAPDAAQTVLALFAIWGLCQILFGLLSLLVLVRYRALVPFMFALLALEHLGRKLILEFTPIVRTGNPPGSIVNLALLALMIVGLALSLWTRRSAAPRGV
jgi:hypothetical protein